MATNRRYPPTGELGQIGPHPDVNADATWVADKASDMSQIHGNTGSYESPQGTGGMPAKPSYGTVSHTGQDYESPEAGPEAPPSSGE